MNLLTFVSFISFQDTQSTPRYQELPLGEYDCLCKYLLVAHAGPSRRKGGIAKERRIPHSYSEWKFNKCRDEGSRERSEAFVVTFHPAGGSVVVLARGKGVKANVGINCRLPMFKAIPLACAGESQFVLIITPAKSVALPPPTPMQYNYYEVYSRARGGRGLLS